MLFPGTLAYEDLTYIHILYNNNKELLAENKDMFAETAENVGSPFLKMVVMFQVSNSKRWTQKRNL